MVFVNIDSQNPQIRYDDYSQIMSGQLLTLATDLRIWKDYIAPKDMITMIILKRESLDTCGEINELTKLWHAT